MAETYRVTVLNRNIVTLIQAGDVARWSRDTAKDGERIARRRSPVRTGRLRDSHVTLPAAGSNQYQKRYRISALAPHGVYVAKGTGIYGPTGTPIRSVKGMGPLPGAVEGLGRRPRYIWYSRGQRPNRWLEETAIELAARI